MQPKTLKMIIKSNHQNVDLIGVAINRLCHLTPLPLMEIAHVELCTVEAVNNCIEHAYQMVTNRDVEVKVTLFSDMIELQIMDSGKTMNPGCLQKADFSSLNYDLDDIDSIPEEGRGLPIIKEVMDKVSYKTDHGRNCLTMIKHFGKETKEMIYQNKHTIS